MKNLLAPDLESLKTTLQVHFDPKPSIGAQCCTFPQASEVSIADFTAELRRLVIHCDFKDTGAVVTLMAMKTWKIKLSLQKSSVLLKTYMTEKLNVLGQREVSVE